MLPYVCGLQGGDKQLQITGLHKDPTTNPSSDKYKTVTKDNTQNPKCTHHIMQTPKFKW